MGGDADLLPRVVSAEVTQLERFEHGEDSRKKMPWHARGVSSFVSSLRFGRRESSDGSRACPAAFHDTTLKMQKALFQIDRLAHVTSGVAVHLVDLELRSLRGDGDGDWGARCAACVEAEPELKRCAEARLDRSHTLAYAPLTHSRLFRIANRKDVCARFFAELVAGHLREMLFLFSMLSRRRDHARAVRVSLCVKRACVQAAQGARSGAARGAPRRRAVATRDGRVIRGVESPSRPRKSKRGLASLSLSLSLS